MNMTDRHCTMALAALMHASWGKKQWLCKVHKFCCMTLCIAQPTQSCCVRLTRTVFMVTPSMTAEHLRNSTRYR